MIDQQEFDINNYIDNLPVLEDSTYIEETVTTSNRSLSKLKIALWNCRGLCTPSKRRKKLTHILSKNYDINILTETKLQEEHIDYFKKYDECKYDVFANTNGNMRGVLLMAKKTTPLKPQILERSECGNSLIFTINHDNQDIIIAAVYGPNEDKPQFYEKIRKKLECSPMQHKILLGDLNLTLEPKKETFNYIGSSNNKQAREEVIKLRDEFEMHDPAETSKYGKTYFTYIKDNGQKGARLDRFLVTPALNNSIIDYSRHGS